MAASPQWKVYDFENNYRGCTKEPEAAAVLAQFYGEGSQVRFGHNRVVWTDGLDELESWDAVAKLCFERVGQTPVSS